MEHLTGREITKNKIEELLQSNSYRTDLKIDYKTGTLLVVAVVLLAMRLVNIDYNTLSANEALYVDVGNQILSSQDGGNALTWMFGSFIYPVFISMMNTLGNGLGIRISSVILSLISIFFVYKTSDKLFGSTTAIWTIILFGISGISVNLGRYADPVALSVALASIAVYFTVLTFTDRQGMENVHSLIAAIFLSLCFITNYFALLIFPIIIVIAIALYLIYAGSLLDLVTDSRMSVLLLVPIFFVAAYGVITYQDLKVLLSNFTSSQVAERSDVLSISFLELSLVYMFAYIGLVIAGKRVYNKLELGFNKPLKSALFTLILLGIVVLLPLVQLFHYHYRFTDELSQHNVYTLLLLSPLAGYTVSQIISSLQILQSNDSMLRIRNILATFLVIVLILFMNNNLDRMWSFENSWPNISEAVAYLKTQDEVDLSNNLFVLAAASETFEYYLADTLVIGQWYNTWFFAYENRFGLEGIQHAIADCALDLVILDNYYTNDINALIVPQLMQSGYVRIYSSLRQLGNGNSEIIRMYKPQPIKNCSWREQNS